VFAQPLLHGGLRSSLRAREGRANGHEAAHLACRISVCRVGALRESIGEVVWPLYDIEPGDESDPRKDFSFRLLVSRIDNAELVLREEAALVALEGAQ
jgi:hypothetical protein